MALRMNPYLMFNGNAREAVAFYEKALDGKVAGIMTFGEGPSDPNHPMPEAAKNLIMHAMLKVDETDMMFSDMFPGTPFHQGNNVTIALVSTDVSRTEKVFSALAEGGQVTMPLQKTFWSPAYGMLTDKFGVPWQITTEAEH